jgi:hypothetical protein
MTSETDLNSDIPDRTHVNCGDKEKGDYTHFFYDTKHKQATIANAPESVWSEHRVGNWSGLPPYVAVLLKQLSGYEKDKVKGLTALQEMLVQDSGPLKSRISQTVCGEKDADRICFYRQVGTQEMVLCDMILYREDYAKTYSFKLYSPTGSLIESQENRNFGEDGYPRQVDIVEYNESGKIIKESKIVIETVLLSPIINKDVYAFKLPIGYTMIDDRVSPALVVSPVISSELESLNGIKVGRIMDDPNKNQESDNKHQKDIGDNSGKAVISQSEENHGPKEQQNKNSYIGLLICLLILLLGGAVVLGIKKTKSNILRG